MASVARYCCCGGCLGPMDDCCFSESSTVRVQAEIDYQGDACGCDSDPLTQDITMSNPAILVGSYVQWTNGNNYARYDISGQWFTDTTNNQTECGWRGSNSAGIGDCCGVTSDPRTASAYCPGFGQSFLYNGSLTVTVSGNTCCNSSGTCIQGADTNCNGTCDEDEV